MFYQQQPARPLLHDLPAQFAADAAACARHQHHLAADIAGDQRGIGRHGIAPQQVVHIKLPELLHPCAAAGEVGHAGNAAHMHRQVAHAADDGVALRAAHAGNGQQHIGHRAVADHTRQVKRRPDFRAIDAAADLGGIIVHIADERVAARRVNSRCRLDARFARAVYQHAPLLTRLAGAAVAEQPADEGAVAADQQQKHERLQNAHAARHVCGVAHEHHVAEEQHAIRGNRLHGRYHRRKPGVAEDGAVQPELDHEGNSQRRRQKIGQRLISMRPNPAVFAQADGQQQRQPGAQHVHAHGQ